MKENFERFIPLEKVDEEKRMVYGYASTPDLDSQGEIVEIEALKKALPEYMKFPTIREMHQPKAAGTTKSAHVKDNGLFIGAKVVADDAWEKVKEGVYRGFSIGGRVKQAVGNVIKDLELTEISLVDVPANKQAVITLFKLDREEVPSVAKKKKKEKEVVEEVKVEEEEVVEEEEAAEKEKAPEAEAPEVVEENEKPEVVVDEAKQVSDTDINIEKIEKVEEEYKVEKREELDKITKLDKAFAKVADLLEKQQERINSLEGRLSKVEDTPAETKTKGSVLVSKSLGGHSVDEDTPELAKAKEEFAQLVKIRETDPERYAREGMSERAFKLKDRINYLS